MTYNSNNDPIGKALGIEPFENSINQSQSRISIIDDLLADSHNDSAMKDFEKARANILELIENGKSALTSLGEISSSSQHPRSYEVYAKLMDTLIQANEKLLSLQTKIREIKQGEEPINKAAKTINNNLFVGSTSELQKMIEEMKKK